MPLGVLALLLAACSGGSDAAPAQSTADAATTRSTSATTPARAAKRGVRLVPIGRFTSPTYITSPPHDTRRLFVVEQAGRIRVVRGGRVLRAPFLDIRSLVTSGGEQGMLSVAFPPDYATSGLFYVYYTDRDQQQRIVAYHRASADRADHGSARLVLRMADTETNHNGGLMLFGPDDLMYVGTGDGGGGDDQHGTRGNAQDLGSLLGKILRIDPRSQSDGQPYGVPSSNPFVGRSGARGEVYSYGLRNPWRFSFDRSTHDLSIADVGQEDIEEVDFVRKGKGRGANFGWRVYEGRQRNFTDEEAPGAIASVIDKTHADGWCSITGGYVVRDPALPALRGRYVYGDYCKGQLRSARLTPRRAIGDRPVGVKTVAGLSSFGEDAAGRVYAVSLNGPVYRLAAAR
jgi:glucose/arabinose dehydrogenase